MGEHEDQPGDKLRQKIRCHMMERKISPALSQLPSDPDIRTLPELEHLPADQPGQRRPVGKCDAKGHAPEALSAGKGDQDQKQHVELTRDIAERFNALYGDTFTVPEAYIPETGKKIMSLLDPAKKMSKSDENAGAYVAILDGRDDIIRKFRRAVTDSGSEVRFADGKDGICNLMNIYSAITGKENDEIEREFEGKGYGDFKLAVGEAVADALSPLQNEYARLIADKAYLEQIMREGAETASSIARKTMRKVYKKTGFVQL